MTAIIGAGLSGLIAATQFPQARVFEANGPESIAHRAVLRFRSDKLARLIGIPFRRVTVHKSIYSAERHCAPRIDLANLYSHKTNGGYLDRSIWNIEPVERFIAPENLQQQLVEMIGARIEWNAPITFDEIGAEPMISTIPMPILAKMLCQLGMNLSDDHLWLNPDGFKFASIAVDRFRIRGADIFQTVYFPDANTTVYRASVTGSLLIIERIFANADQSKLTKTVTDPNYNADALDMVLRSFGMENTDCELIELNHRQRFGKIVPIADEPRRQFIYDASIQHRVYSLGRFATWRNILLDDVIDDVAIIKRLINTGSYGSTLHHVKSKKEPS